MPRSAVSTPSRPAATCATGTAPISASNTQLAVRSFEAMVPLPESEAPSYLITVVRCRSERAAASVETLQRPARCPRPDPARDLLRHQPGPRLRGGACSL